MRAVVVGASSGLGRCIGVGLAERGAKVALLARRRDRLESAAADAGPGTLAIECDVTDEASVASAIGKAAAELGGIDASSIRPASAPGATRRHRRGHLAQGLRHQRHGRGARDDRGHPPPRASGGTAVYLSSVSASLTPPWPGLGAYGVSKAALDKLVEAWRTEHPDIGFTRCVVGDCAGGEGEAMTGFADDWDMDLLMEFHPIWTARGLIAGSLIDVEHLVEAVDAVLRAGASVSIPRSPSPRDLRPRPT